YHASVAKVVQVNASPQPPSAANGHTGTGSVDPYPAGLTGAPPVTAPCQQPSFPTPPNYKKCNPEDIEAQLDSQQVAGLAPGATELFYLSYNPLICLNSQGFFVKTKKDGTCVKGGFHYPLIGIQLADDSLQQSIADNRADSMSLSWGEPENLALASGYINKAMTAVGNVEFASLAAEGTAVFVSSGDNGAWECFDPNTGEPLGIACPSYPATDPNVTAVGGVNLQVDEAGRLNGQITAWADNTTHGGSGNFRNDVGSGGGISQVFSAPQYQADAIGVKQREIPDMSMDADPATGVAIVAYAKWDPFVFAEGGTSASAPEANAEWALVLSACKATSGCGTSTGAASYRLGNAAPWFYEIFSGKANLPYNQVFYDVIYGDNQANPATPVPASPSPFPTPAGYSAGPGYDMVTGLGVPFAGHLINAIVTGANAK
ncbi:MAG TPA: S8 family serine peptidase, partial [Candidatus Acidoferrales bacterium]|nr:S8 family serine peptidase [Candidatus Acidoferrales bacterium]